MFWVSVTYTLTRSSILVSRVTATILIALYFLGLVQLLRVTLVSRVTARSLQNNIVGYVLPSGESEVMQ